MKPLVELTLPSFAKINLVLRVLNRRRDGYHSLETIFQTIGLHDVLTFRFFKSSRLHLVLDMGDNAIPADSLNLIWKACHMFNEEHPVGCKIEIEARKQIPAQSGLGGGSSNAAVTMIALSRFLGWPLNRRELGMLAPFKVPWRIFTLPIAAERSPPVSRVPVSSAPKHRSSHVKPIQESSLYETSTL